MMSEDRIELLSAFLDGEPVPWADLAEAFHAPGAQAALRDFALLRAQVQEEEYEPSAVFYRDMRQALDARPEVRPWWSRKLQISLPALAVAAFLVIVVGLWAIFTDRHPGPEAARPPVPDQVIHFEPGQDWSGLRSEENEDA